MNPFSAGFGHFSRALVSHLVGAGLKVPDYESSFLQRPPFIPWLNCQSGRRGQVEGDSAQSVLPSTINLELDKIPRDDPPT